MIIIKSVMPWDIVECIECSKRKEAYALINIILKRDL